MNPLAGASVIRQSVVPGSAFSCATQVARTPSAPSVVAASVVLLVGTALGAPTTVADGACRAASRATAVATSTPVRPIMTNRDLGLGMSITWHVDRGTFDDGTTFAV